MFVCGLAFGSSYLQTLLVVLSRIRGLGVMQWIDVFRKLVVDQARARYSCSEW